MAAHDKYLVDFLNNHKNLSLNTSRNIKYNKVKEMLDTDLILYHIQEITFEEESPRKEAFENVISSLRIDGINFIYLIVGDEYGVHFYFGIVKNLNETKELEIDISDIGEDILKSSIEGNFRGSKVENIKGKKTDIKNKISTMKYCGILEGVPGINEENEKIQGVDRLIDVMSGDEFIISIVSTPVTPEEIISIENSLYKIYDKLSPLAKRTIQESKDENISKTVNITKNISESIGYDEGENISKAESQTQGKNTGVDKTTATIKSSSETSGDTYKSTNTTNNGTEQTSKRETTDTLTSDTKTKSEGKSKNNTTVTSRSETESKVLNDGSSTSMEFSDKSINEWLKYLDEVLLARLDYGKSKGLFNSNISLFSKNKSVLLKLANTMRALFSGKNGNKVPLSLKIVDDENHIESLRKFQIPRGVISEKSREEIEARVILSQNIRKDEFEVGNWISTNELSLIAGLPQKEVAGLALKEEVEFGLNPNKGINEENKISLGKLVKSGNITNIPVNLDKNDLDKHIFIAGVTGSGKTTTCQKLLLSSNLPFLVIEPAKTEYRILTKKYKDILIFTLGNDKVAPFRLNPFEFFPHENITSRVDMIKASIESAFEMEAAIPQIIESAIYKCYENLGWDISTNENINYKQYKDAFAEGEHSFPTLEDLIDMTEVVTKEQGFDDRLKNDYIGSIKARLQGLLVGSKGLMLNTKRSVNFKDLIKEKVILELEEIKSGGEKSLIMGFILTNLNEAIKANYIESKNKNEKFKHITLIEEAHRLLSRYESGDSLNKKQGVETFTDMLAEVRKYGESLIIVDQIPNKLTPEVLKNTNTKIIHKLFAEDDKEAIGNTISLNDEQKKFLSNLETGRVIISSQGFSKPLQIQIDELDNLSTTGSDIISEEELRNNIMKYYQKNYKLGVIEGTEKFKEMPTIEQIENQMKYERHLKVIIQNWKKIFKEGKIETKFNFNSFIESRGLTEKRDLIVKDIMKNYQNKKDNEELDRENIIKEFINRKYIKIELDDTEKLNIVK